jgi:glutathione-regulated potassium-efflux system ancillary protein KefC
MSVNFGLLLEEAHIIVALILGLFVVKGIVLWLIARQVQLPADEWPLFVLLLAQGGEFAFVLLGLGAGHEAIPREAAEAITLAVAISMLLTPFLLVLHDRVLMRRARAPRGRRTRPRRRK